MGRGVVVGGGDAIRAALGEALAAAGDGVSGGGGRGRRAGGGGRGRGPGVLPGLGAAGHGGGGRGGGGGGGGGGRRRRLRDQGVQRGPDGCADSRRTAKARPGPAGGDDGRGRGTADRSAES